MSLKANNELVLSLQDLCGRTFKIHDDLVIIDGEGYLLLSKMYSPGAELALKLTGQCVFFFRAISLLSGSTIKNIDDIVRTLPESIQEFAKPNLDELGRKIEAFVIRLANDEILIFDGLAKNNFPIVNLSVFSNEVELISLDEMLVKSWPDKLETNQKVVAYAKSHPCTTSEVCCSVGAY